MSKIFMTEDDLGEAARHLLDPADESLDPLNILLSREEDADEAFFTALAELLQERKARKRALGTPNKPARKNTKRITFH